MIVYHRSLSVNKHILTSPVYRFASYAHMMSFWSQIEPATHDIVRVTRAQSVGHAVATVHTFLFSSMFCCYTFFFYL